ncbi:MAG: aminoacyl--tRNA ligase-related protein [Halobaculum sp.]
MRRSDLFCPTTRETRGSGTEATKLLQRAGLIREFGSGLWGLTPVGERVREKLVRRIRTGMTAVGAQRVRLPGLQYSERWVESGRWESFEGEMLTLSNREGQRMCLAPSHEEGMVHLPDGHLRSYDSLPLCLYQIASKFRDDHARNGLVRCKEFTMKDAYSFHRDRESLAATYRAMGAAYESILDDIGLAFVAPVEEGSDRLLHCDTENCHFGLTDEHERFQQHAAGDSCPDCDGTLHLSDGIEVGHIFQLGTRYSEAMGLTVDDADGSEATVEMGSYGLGVERLLQTLIQQHADDDGCRFPVTEWGCVAPYRAAVIPVGDNEEVLTTARRLHEELGRDGLLYDDLSVGERFAESDLLGVPAKLIVGNTYRETGEVDLETRDGESRRLAPEDALAAVERFGSRQ